MKYAKEFKLTKGTLKNPAALEKHLKHQSHLKDITFAIENISSRHLEVILRTVLKFNKNIHTIFFNQAFGDGANFTHLFAKYIKYARNLKKLRTSIVNDDLDEISKDAKQLIAPLKRLTKIESFSIPTGHTVPNEDMSVLAGFLPSLTKLACLNLSLHCFKEEGIEVLVKVLPHLPALKLLSLEGSLNDAENVKKLLRTIPSLKNLERLNLAGNLSVNTKALKEILPALPTLRHINLSGIRTRKKSTAFLNALPHLPEELLTLVLDRNSLGEASWFFGTKPIKKFAQALKKLIYLRVLSLNDNGIDDDDLNTLVAHFPPNLLTLHLKGNNIATKGVKTLANMLVKTKLEVLNLESQKNQRLGDEDIAILASVLPDTVLKRLNIGWNNLIGGAGIDALIDVLVSPSTKLTFVDLTNSDLSNSQLERFCDILLRNRVFLRTLNNEELSKIQRSLHTLFGKKDEQKIVTVAPEGVESLRSGFPKAQHPPLKPVLYTLFNNKYHQKKADNKYEAHPTSYLARRIY